VSAAGPVVAVAPPLRGAVPESIPVSVREASERVFRALRRLAEQKRVTLVPPGSSDWVATEPDDFAQVLIGLVSDAIETVPEGGAVRVESVASGNEVEVAVGEAGNGTWPPRSAFYVRLPASAFAPTDPWLLDPANASSLRGRP
jgi:hypothetical protein